MAELTTEQRKALNDAVELILSSPEVRKPVEEAIVRFASNDKNIKEAVEAHRENSRDSYRSMLHYGAGVITFSLALFLGITASLTGSVVSGNASAVRFVRLILCSSSIVIFGATIFLACVQFRKFKHENAHQPSNVDIGIKAGLVMLVLLGAFVALFSVEFGLSLAVGGSYPQAVKDAVWRLPALVGQL